MIFELRQKCCSLDFVLKHSLHITVWLIFELHSHPIDKSNNKNRMDPTDDFLFEIEFWSKR